MQIYIFLGISRSECHSEAGQISKPSNDVLYSAPLLFGYDTFVSIFSINLRRSTCCKLHISLLFFLDYTKRYTKIPWDITNLNHCFCTWSRRVKMKVVMVVFCWWNKVKENKAIQTINFWKTIIFVSYLEVTCFPQNFSYILIINKRV